MKEFKDWEITTNKSWTSLKSFVHGACQCCLVAVSLQNTSAQQGYASMQNTYAMLANGGNLDNDTTTGTQTAALVTMGSMLGNTYATPAQEMAQVMTSPELVPVITSLAVNQQALLQHMAAMSFHAQPSLQACTFPAPDTTPFHVPPIQHLTIPGTTHYNAGGFNHGQGGQSAGDHGRGPGCHGHSCMPFADHMAACVGGLQGGSGVQPMFLQVGGFQNLNTQHMHPPHSNVTKKNNYWNVCYSCGFDIEDGHTLMTCPADWRKPTHVTGFTRNNSKSYIARGYNL
jgi:hypothetical protein